jgi:NAD(P)-dependent dehydrogenase (short-subunit alcohol dehydrogenase family)
MNPSTACPGLLEDQYDLTGSRALVTGGGRGIGRAVALAFARAGAEVALVARSADELAATACAIRAEGGTVAYAKADVSNETSLARAVERLRDELGPLDILVNNAGVVGPIGPAWEVDTDAWWATMDVNLRGVFLATQLVLPEMVSRGRGRVLNVTSEAGVRRWPLVSAYSVSKAAVTKFTENVAWEVRRFGVSVFSVHPGLLPIGMSAAMPAEGAHTSSPYEDHVWTWVRREFAAGRGADPDAAVMLITRLAAGDADALSGRHISVHDDLDAMLSHIEDVRHRDLHVLRPSR